MPPTQASILHSYHSVVLTSWHTTTTTILSLSLILPGLPPLPGKPVFYIFDTALMVRT